uniref:DDE Tnp4 domain-containing protein n=1 Tax=Cucumis melo TaxID=3656 RepID=A0A9I9E687_CUCME
MEISSFPFLNQEEFLPIFNLFSDMDNNPTTPFNVNPTPKKRRRSDPNSDDFNNFSFTDENDEPTDDPLLKLPCWFDPQPESPQSWLMDSQKPKPTNDFHLSDQIPKKPRRASPENPSPVKNNPAGGGGTQQRRLWVKDRSKDWWDQCNHPDFPDEEFRRAFRMSKSTFDMICKELDSTVMKKDTMLRVAIPVRQRVAVCIWRLATGEPLRLVSKRFGLGISTCHKLVLEVCSAIRKVLMPKFLQWPDESKLTKIKQEFESISGIPKVGGSIYTTHIPIIAPRNNVAAYFNKRHTERNQKTSYSITVQGVVDPSGVFTDVCIGWPGSMPDDQVLEKSLLYERASMGLLNDVFVVGNSGYPLMDWLLVPYTVQNLTWTQHGFNEKVGEIQAAAKAAFGRLKGRWTCLQKRTEVKLQELPVVLGACCVLHNICEMRKEKFDPELKFEVYDDEMLPENNGLRSVSAIQARDHIAHNLLHHGIAGTGFL